MVRMDSHKLSVKFGNTNVNLYKECLSTGNTTVNAGLQGYKRHKYMYNGSKNNWTTKTKQTNKQDIQCTQNTRHSVFLIEIGLWKVCERFEPRSHFKSRLSLIAWVNVVLNRTVVVHSDWSFNNLCGSHLQSQSELYHVSWWYYTLVIDLIGQLRRDVIGSLSVKPWCYSVWRLVISNCCVSIRLLSQFNSRLLLVKLSVLQSFFRS